MASPSRTRVDADGVRVTTSGGLGGVVRIAVAAGVLVAVATVVLVLVIRLYPSAAAPPQTARGPELPPSAAAVVDVPRSPATANAPAPAGERPRPVPQVVPRAPAPPTGTPPGTVPEITAREVIPWLRAQGETTGIAAFPPPGTDPPKTGIIVPDDFPLPEGYVRHHQVTDDGEPLPPILMFHPDYELHDANGNPVAMPKDRVVPPEMAPPGLPIRMLEIPTSPSTRGASRKP